MHVLLIDDHVLFRQGMTFLLSDLDEQLEFSEAGTCEEGLKVLSETEVDLILLDLNMPGSGGLSALRDIKQAFPQVPLSVLSGVDDPGLIRDAIEQGASGFVPKSSSSAVLVAALRLVLAGGVYLPRSALNAVDVSSTVVAEGTAPTEEGRICSTLLSQRQTEVLFKAIQGKPNKVISRELRIAEGTVKAHLSAAFKALRVHNRTEAVFSAAKLGLKPPTPDQK
jgi:DNA-binding NarL/FixJ family response regulator